MRAFLSIFGAATVFAAAALANETQALNSGELRLTLKFNERSLSFSSTLEPLARRTMEFEGQDYAPTESMRAAVAELARILASAKPASAFVITGYAADPVVAYRRARAVRGALIERHEIAAARLVAAGRAAPGHDGGATIVDLHEIDPTKCGGCGPTPFRSIAYDSGTMRLVTVLPEKLALADAAASPEAPPARIALAPTSRAAAPESRRIVPAPKARPAPQQAAAASGCPRPRIIIDDYYPGGPLVPCLRRAMRSDR